MAFDPNGTMIAAKGAVDIIDKGVDIVGKIDTTYTKNREIRKNGDVDRNIRAKHAVIEDRCRVIDVAANALTTAINVCVNISGAINASKEINLKIEETRKKCELEKQKLDNERQKINNEYENESKKQNNSHEQKLRQMEYRHIEEMTKINNAQENIKDLLEILKNLVQQDPSNANIFSYITSLNSSLNTLTFNKTDNYIEG